MTTESGTTLDLVEARAVWKEGTTLGKVKPLSDTRQVAFSSAHVKTLNLQNSHISRHLFKCMVAETAYKERGDCKQVRRQAGENKR